jgi:abequosyltransferase
MILLSICIPTYNRSPYLKRCLDAIFSQTRSDLPIEVVVSDNASTDDTAVVMDGFLQRDLPLRYLKNSTNQGPDKNVIKCYEEAIGTYVMVMGDDDILCASALEVMTPLLKSCEYGVLYLNYYGFIKDPTAERPGINFFRKNYIYQAEKILKKVRGNLGFISAYVIRRELIDNSLLITYDGTNLNHVPMILQAIRNSKLNLFIGDYLLGQQVANSGGFKYFEVISRNYYKVLKESLKGSPKSMDWICNEFISNVFPWAILQARRKTNPQLFEENGYDIIKTYYKDYFSFWLFVFPMGKLPISLIGAYFFFVKIIAKTMFFLRRIQVGRTLCGAVSVKTVK